MNVWDTLCAWIAAHDALVVALVTVVVSSAFSVWQVRRTFREQQANALADQRYLIYLEVGELAVYYHQKLHPELADEAIPDQEKCIKNILALIVRPTSMKTWEVKRILRVTLSATADHDPEEIALSMLALHGELLANLRPELVSVAKETMAEHAETMKARKVQRANQKASISNEVPLSIP